MMDLKELKTYRKDSLLGALCIWMLVNAVWADK